MKIYIARAFCRNGLGGNRAGVVVGENSLPAAQMQAIAKELGFSETIFISKLAPRVYKALYFTPNSPIEFCGHATLAAFAVLRERGDVTGGTYRVETAAGPCEMHVTDSLLFLSQLLPVFGEFVPAEELAPAFGISAEEIGSAQIVSTGLRDIFVPLRDRETLFSLKPDFDQILELSKKYNAVGMHVFALDPPGEESTAHCRNFAPLYGIPEESATGSSNGALACYLFERGVTENTFLFKQGDILGSPSNIYAHLTLEGGKITKVECGGEAIVDEVR